MPDRLRIRTLSGDVCTLEFIDRPKIYYTTGYEEFERCISKLENLTPFVEEQENQLNLFK